MDRCLTQLGVRTVPLLILTHFHADHVDGLAGVLERRGIGQIWVSPLAAPAPEVAIVQDLAQRRRIPVISPPVGTRSVVGAIRLEVLGPVSASGGGDTESAAENDGSLVVMATAAGVRILLTGDLEPPGQAAILAGRPDLHADVLKVPHHGSARQDPAFFAATGSRVAIMSCRGGQRLRPSRPPHAATGSLARDDGATDRPAGSGGGHGSRRSDRRGQSATMICPASHVRSHSSQASRTAFPLPIASSRCCPRRPLPDTCLLRPRLRR